MKRISATELARNLSRILDRLSSEGGEIVIERNARPVAQLRAVPAEQNALEAMADLYRTLPDDAAKDWEADSKSLKLRDSYLNKAFRDPWVS